MPYKSKEKQKECSKKALRKHKEKCLNTGICWICRKNPLTGNKICKICAEKHSKDNKTRKEKRFNQGLCTHCGRDNFLSKKSKLCGNCYIKKHLKNILIIMII